MKNGTSILLLVRRWGAAAMLVALSLMSVPSARGAGNGELRGERVGWARLKTPSEWWRRHATGDPVLMRFLRENTNLNIDPTWYVADITKLDEMCAYPLLFSQGIGMLDEAKEKANLAEYVRRGGFLLIDCCINASITPDADEFLTEQVQVLSEILPEARVVALPPTHNIYRCYFQMPGGKPPHTYNNNVYNPAFARHGLYGIMIGPKRMAGVISLSGLQCGWDGMIAPRGHDIACMQMLVDIYVYAMLQGG